MISRASVSFIRISPRKVRYVIDMIRTKPVAQAQAILNGSPRRGAGIVRKLLDQAVDAAAKNSNVDAANLYVSKVLADGGTTMKRHRAMSMGRAGVIRKRTSHIQIELDAIKKNFLPSAKAPASKAALKTKTKVSTPPAKGGSASGGKKPAAKKLAGAK